MFLKISTKNRDDKNMEVRIDEVVKSKEDVEKLGISARRFYIYRSKNYYNRNWIY